MTAGVGATGDVAMTIAPEASTAKISSSSPRIMLRANDSIAAREMSTYSLRSERLFSCRRLHWLCAYLESSWDLNWTNCVATRVMPFLAVKIDASARMKRGAAIRGSTTRIIFVRMRTPLVTIESGDAAVK